jgi:hypothetical protein
VASHVVRLHPLAADEAEGARAWYLARNPTVADAFVLLVVADHPLLTSHIENAPVTFKFYTLKQNTAGDIGPAYWFDLAETQISKAAYCDVGVALSRELGLGDYRPTARPEGYRNSPQAMSNNRSRGP